tara:strand:+ start:970 stop:2832 length:1863 start_codon:yes stop_codon:yes gene_type:complete
VNKMADRQGYTTWERALSAGAVDSYIAWDDSEIMRDHAIGITKDTMGKCFPIDLAVAYTLVSSGPNNPLTLKELVNEYTRTATVMMSGKVGFGSYLHPDMALCNHDMKDTNVYEFPYTTVVDGVLQVNSQQGSITESEVYDDMPPHIKEQCSIFSDDFTCNQHEFSKNASREEMLIGYMVGGFDSVRLWLESNYETKTWVLKSNRIPTPVKTLGECGFEDVDGVKAPCKHHNNNLTAGWVMVRHPEDAAKTLSLWRRGAGCTVTSTWNNDHLTNNDDEHRSRFSGAHTKVGFVTTDGEDRIIPFEKVSRKAARIVSEKQVIKEIRGALSRMKNWSGNRSLVSDDTEVLLDEDGNVRYKMNEGYETSTPMRTRRTNNTKYSWSKWTWARDMQVYVAETHSKNRKEGETQCKTCYLSNVLDAQGDSYCECGQGWKYVKQSSRMSYGHEIAKFSWEPITPPHVWCFDSWPTLDIISPTSIGLKNLRELMIKGGARLNLCSSQSQWIEENNARETISKDNLLNGGMKVTKVKLYTPSVIHINSNIMVDDKPYEPEIAMTPSEILNTLMFGSGDDIEEMGDKYGIVGMKGKKSVDMRIQTGSYNYKSVKLPKPTTKVDTHTVVIA